MKVFNYDGPIISFLSRVADLLLLNVLTIVFSVPLITIGASVTAAHYTALKIHREEGHVLSCFWKSFKENLRQSMCIEIVFAAFCVVVNLAYNGTRNMNGAAASLIPGIIMGMLIFALFFWVWIIPLQSRFSNPIVATFKNAYYMAFKHFCRTLLMALLNLLSIGILILALEMNSVMGLGFWLMFGISAPINFCAMTYDKVFEKLEEMISN